MSRKEVRWSLYQGVAVRRPPCPFVVLLVGFSPDHGEHFDLLTFIVSSN